VKRDIGIGTIVIIGLVLWWLTQRREAQAAGLLPDQTYPHEISEYERLHMTVPITASTERLFEVYGEG